MILCTPSLLPLPHKNSQSLTASLAAPPSGVSKLSLAFSCVTRFALRDLFMVEITPTYGRPFFDFPFIQFREYRSTNDIIIYIYIYRYRYMCVYVCIYIYILYVYICMLQIICALSGTCLYLVSYQTSSDRPTQFMPRIFNKGCPWNRLCFNVLSSRLVIT